MKYNAIAIAIAMGQNMKSCTTRVYKNTQELQQHIHFCRSVDSSHCRVK